MDSRKLIKWWEADGVWAMVDVDIPRFDGKVEKINNTLPHRLPGCIDNYVKARGETRSGFLAEAARRAMQGGRPHRRRQPSRLTPAPCPRSNEY